MAPNPVLLPAKDPNIRRSLFTLMRGRLERLTVHQNSCSGGTKREHFLKYSKMQNGLANLLPCFFAILTLASGVLTNPQEGQAKPFSYPQIAQSSKHPPSMTCYNYGDHIRCENGQVYILPSRVGSPVIVQPLPKKPLELSDAARKTFDRILKNSLRDAKSYCRQLRIEAIGARKACIRQQLDRFVLVTRDEDLITYYETEFKNKVKY